MEIYFAIYVVLGLIIGVVYYFGAGTETWRAFAVGFAWPWALLWAAREMLYRHFGRKTLTSRAKR